MHVDDNYLMTSQLMEVRSIISEAVVIDVSLLCNQDFGEGFHTATVSEVCFLSLV